MKGTWSKWLFGLIAIGVIAAALSFGASRLADRS